MLFALIFEERRDFGIWIIKERQNVMAKDSQSSIDFREFILYLLENNYLKKNFKN